MLLTAEALKEKKAEKINLLSIRRDLKNQIKQIKSLSDYRFKEEELEYLQIQLELIEDDLEPYHEIHINRADISNYFLEIEDEVSALQSKINDKKAKLKMIKKLM